MNDEAQLSAHTTPHNIHFHISNTLASTHKNVVSDDNPHTLCVLTGRNTVLAVAACRASWELHTVDIIQGMMRTNTRPVPDRTVPIMALSGRFRIAPDGSSQRVQQRLGTPYLQRLEQGSSCSPGTQTPSPPGTLGMHLGGSPATRMAQRRCGSL